MSIDVLTPVARLVGGHPMRSNPKTDDHGKPKLAADGTPQSETYIGIAIPKGPERHWSETVWGQQIHEQAVADWPRGEHGAATFAWKIVDGDSAVPNRKGIAPNTREGYPGHWVINASTQLPIKCYHAGRYSPHEQIQNEKEIKPGDYCRVLLQVRGNGPVSQSPGIYVNPVLFELTRAGIEIVLSSGPSAVDAFGGAAPVLPAGALVDKAVAAPAPVPVPAPLAPAHDFLNGPGVAPPPPPAAPKVYTVQGQQYTAAQLLGFGWSQAQIDALG